MRARTGWLLCLALAGAGPARALSYVPSSSGLETPVWEAGRTELELADLDGDGDLDLVSLGDHGNPRIQSTEEGLMVWFGDGSGGWTAFQTGHFGYGGVAVGDLDGDGRADVAYGIHHDYAAGDLGDQILEAALGDGTGRAWTPWDDGLAGNGETYGMFGTDLADVDLDGDLDLAALSFGYGNGLRVYLNRGDGTWSPGFARPEGNTTSNEIAFGDVDADGIPDLAAGFQEGTVWRGTGTGAFVLADGALPAPGTLGREGPSLGDVDADGRDDLAFVTSTGGLQVWLWRPGDAWVPASTGLPSSGSWETTQLVDMDGDGATDLVGAGRGRVTVWTGDGGASWAQAATFTVGVPGDIMALRAGGDVDHNGLPDLVLVEAETKSLFTTQNVLKAYREAAPRPAQGVTVRVVEPRGGEVFAEGSVRFVSWTSAVPAGAAGRARIELSRDGGPDVLLADDLPDSGRFQWRVAPGLAAAAARLRVTVTLPGGDSGSAGTPAPFAIAALDVDGDGIPGWDDCAPGDPGAHHAPGEVADLGVDRAPEDPGGAVTATWASQAAQAGSATVYDLVTGPLSDLGPDGVLDRASCGADDLAATSATLPLAVAPGEGAYVLVRAENACGTGTYGASRAAPGACP